MTVDRRRNMTKEGQKGHLSNLNPTKLSKVKVSQVTKAVGQDSRAKLVEYSRLVGTR